MALPGRTEVFRKTESEELDLIGANYYKLPFCDDDMKHFEDMDGSGDDWVNSMLEDRFMNGTNELLTPTSPSSSSGALSPSSSSGSSSSGNFTNEHAYSLINDRPDTPLTAVKFEEFSNDYPLGDFDYNAIKTEYPDSFNFVENFSLNPPEEEEDESFNIDVGSEFALDEEQPIQALKASISTVHAPRRTMDRSLNSTVEGLSTNVITISKMGNTVTVKKENSSDEPMDYSMTKVPKCNRPTTLVTSSNCSNNDSPKSCETNLANVLTLATDAAQIPTNCDAQFVTQNLTSQRATFTTVPTTAPTAKVTTNALTHRTQIQIPTSTLQTILKSGRLITRLQQEGQFLPRIKIKTEPNDGEQQYVRICQPSIQLPPTPPSSNNSDNEGSSSPRGVATNVIPEATTIQLTANLHELSSANLASQLLTSSQRLNQTHGSLLLTEEEKRTLESEGYPIPESLPLSKVEEKALKKVRRKIKNKISAQESRRKKKEYVEALERKMECYNQENGDLRRKLDSLESSNQNLLGQLRSLQLLVAEKMPKPSRTVTTQTSSCLMMVVLCFAVFLGGWVPFLSPFQSKDMGAYPAPGNPMDMMRNWRSRVVMSYSADQWEQQGYCDVTGCHDDFRTENPFSKPDLNPDTEGPKTDEGADTYDEPASGRVVMNDTKDQIIANTMEPRDVAAVLASRKVSGNGRKVEMAAVDVMGQGIKKIVSVVNQHVTE